MIFFSIYLRQICILNRSRMALKPIKSKFQYQIRSFKTFLLLSSDIYHTIRSPALKAQRTSRKAASKGNGSINLEIQQIE